MQKGGDAQGLTADERLCRSSGTRHPESALLALADKNNSPGLKAMRPWKRSTVLGSHL
jgi:hypothetical protein